jgi:glycolate oxidase subunit GlcD
MATPFVGSLVERFGAAVLREEHVRRLYGYDATGMQGLPDAVVQPRNEEDVLFLVREARAHHAALVARGSGTGLSGGAVAQPGSASVSFERMRQFLSVDPERRRAWVEAGHVNGLLDPKLAVHGLFFPPDPASHRVSTIGGNIAENAGGPHAVKYGVTGMHVVGLRVVDARGRAGTLAAGAIQPGPDLVSLVVGSEGTLALVLSAELSLEPRPEAVATSLVAFRDMVQATDFVSAIIAQGMVPATLEFLDRAHIEAIQAWGVARYPDGAGAVLVIEFDGQAADVARDVAQTEALAAERGVLDCKTTRDAQEREALWLGRRGAYAVIGRFGRRRLTQDVTVPRQRLTEMFSAIERIAQEHGLMVATVGHAGDGNLHPSFPYDPADAETTRRVHEASEAVMRACVAMDGSISGEHGVGLEKLHQMSAMFGPAELGLMAAVRRAFDPDRILNPGKAVPEADRLPASGEGAEICAPASADEVHLAVLHARASQSPLTLTLEQLRGIDVTPENLTCTIGAGEPIGAIVAAMRERRLEFPLQPLRAESVAEAVLANDYGPGHVRLGTARNHLVAATYVTGAGEIVRMGRPVVKNVAGYDLFRLLIGSRGRLGVPVSFTFRLVPRRETAWWRSWACDADDVLACVPSSAEAVFALPGADGFSVYAQLPQALQGWSEAPEAPELLHAAEEECRARADLLDLACAPRAIGQAIAAMGRPPALLLPVAARLLAPLDRDRAEAATRAAAGEEGASVRALYGAQGEPIHRISPIEEAWHAQLESVFDPEGVLHSWFGRGRS